MTTPAPAAHHTDSDEAFARALASRLSDTQQALPYVVTERLRAARQQALASHNPKAGSAQGIPALAVAAHAGARVASVAGLVLAGTPSTPPPTWPAWVQRLLIGLPLLVLALGLFTIGAHTNEQATSALADLDAALLTSDLPPAAYADPGFVHYLQTSHSHSHATAMSAPTRRQPSPQP
ncbi:MAG: DUF3619 family protein [Comamonas sp.]|nr:DUF3619 family protein [Comamonas sp.]